MFINKNSCALLYIVCSGSHKMSLCSLEFWYKNDEVVIANQVVDLVNNLKPAFSCVLLLPGFKCLRVLCLRKRIGSQVSRWTNKTFVGNLDTKTNNNNFCLTSVSSEAKSVVLHPSNTYINTVWWFPFPSVMFQATASRYFFRQTKNRIDFSKRSLFFF
jgi:hypothetical protein